MRNYSYTAAGTAHDNQTWIVNGSVTCEFAQVFERVMRDAFGRLTQGKAAFGSPGRGCIGPYTVEKLSIEARPGPDTDELLRRGVKSWGTRKA
jgi:hypothetical protein